MAYSTLATHEGLSPLYAITFSLWTVFLLALDFLPPFLIQVVLEVAACSANGPCYNLSFIVRVIKSDLHDVFLYVAVLGAAKHVFFKE